MRTKRMLGISSTLLAGLALALGAGTTGQSRTSAQERIDLTETAAIACMVDKARLDGLSEMQSSWSDAVDRWHSSADGRASSGESNRYDAMQRRYNRANDRLNDFINSYNARCGTNVYISRAVFDAVCTGQSSSFCAGFSFD